MMGFWTVLLFILELWLAGGKINHSRFLSNIQLYIPCLALSISVPVSVPNRCPHQESLAAKNLRVLSSLK